jgi:hypothetical protein
LLIKNHRFHRWGFNQQSKIINQQLLQVCEEARDCRHGESSLPPAAAAGNKKGEYQCLV